MFIAELVYKRVPMRSVAINTTSLKTAKALAVGLSGGDPMLGIDLVVATDTTRELAASRKPGARRWRNHVAVARNDAAIKNVRWTTAI